MSQDFSHISTSVAFSTTQVPRPSLNTDKVEIKERKSDLKAILKKIQKKAEIGKHTLLGPKKQINLARCQGL